MRDGSQLVKLQGMGEKITDIKQMDSKYGRISYYISPKLLYAQTGYVWEGK